MRETLGFPVRPREYPLASTSREGARVAPALVTILLVRHLAGELDQLLATLHVTGEVVPDRPGGLLPRREGLVVHRHDVHARLLELLVDADVVLLRGGIGVLLQPRT